MQHYKIWQLVGWTAWVQYPVMVLVSTWPPIQLLCWLSSPVAKSLNGKQRRRKKKTRFHLAQKSTKR